MIWIGLAALLIVAGAATAAMRRRTGSHDERYRGMLDQLPRMSVATFDRELRCAEVLGGASRESGVVPDDFVGKRPEEIYPGLAADELVEHCEAALRGESQTFELHSPVTGRDFWIHIVPLRQGGEIVGGMTVAQDVGDLRTAQRGRAMEVGRRQLILDVMNEAYVEMSADGIVTGWNRAAAQAFGYSDEEAIGAWIGDLIIPAADHDDLRRLLARPLAGDELRYDLRVERQALHRDGREFTVELAATLVEIDGVRSLHTLMHDISDRKRAERELRQHSDDVGALADAVGELARSTSSQDARMAICRAARSVAGADAAILFEPGTSGEGLRPTAAQGLDVGGALLPFTERDGSVAAFTTLESLFISDIRGHPAVARSVFSGSGVVSAYWTPVNRNPDETAIGVIAVAWIEPVSSLSDRVAQIMNVISAEAAVAIERAALLDRLERMARTDGLTGLLNRSSWDTEIAREFSRAQRSGAPLTVAMLDLDRFKEYNDRHGHLAGDRLLKDAAAAWSAVLRDTDLLARYGGEEFAIALPGWDTTLAASLVERLRSVTPEGESCSAGIAQWDRHETPENLLDRADAALYEAKHTGRDKIILA